MSEHFNDHARAMIVARLQAIQTFIDPTEAEDCDVRLRYYEGYFELLWGDVSFDTDHRGVCGASSVTLDMEEAELEGVADDLIEQVEDELAQEEDGNE